MNARRIAVSGFLMILKHFRVLGGVMSSQASQSLTASQVQWQYSEPSLTDQAMLSRTIYRLNAYDK